MPPKPPPISAGIDAQVADLHAEDLRGQRAHLEMALAGGPDLGLAIGVAARDAGVRLDIGLMHCRGLELLLDHHVGLREAGLEIAGLEFEPLRDVRGLRRRRLDAARDHVLEQQRRIGRHRLVHVDDVRQHLVVDLDQRQRFLRDAALMAATAAIAWPSYSAFSRARMLRVTCQKFTATRSGPM